MSESHVDVCMSDVGRGQSALMERQFFAGGGTWTRTWEESVSTSKGGFLPGGESTHLL